MVDKNNLSIIYTNKGNNLYDLSMANPVLLVFLRHFGCVYCKESMMDIAKRRAKLEKKGILVVLVHMSDYQLAEQNFIEFSLNNIEHISDPECRLYALFGLTKGTTSQLFGLKTWIRGFELAVTKQILPFGPRIGDGFQMPGVFLLKEGEIKSSFIHKSVADKPDYEEIIEVCAI